MVGRIVGQRVKRVEDPRILTGRGRYVDDLRLPRMVHLAFLRSPYPHARIAGIDTTSAAEMPGVVGVYTGEQLRDLTMPIQLQGPEGYRAVTYHPLAVGKVRFVGDPLAVVVALTRALAEDACESIEVDYEPLPAVTGLGTATGSHADTETDAAAVFDDVPDNVFYEEHHVYGDPDAAFASADRVVRAVIAQHRHANVPMEGHAALVDYNPASGDMTVYASHQVPHVLRMNLAAFTGISANRVAVLTADIGGAFG